jgi:two-component system, NtrC family, sensor kinase
MKKLFIFFLASCMIITNSFGQSSREEIKEFKDQLLKAKHDSTRGALTYQLAYGYRFSDIDSSLYYSDVTIELADKLNLPSIKAQMLSLKGATVLEAGKLPESLQFQFEALKISEKIKDTSNIAFALNRIGNIYMELADYKKANEYYFRSKDLFEKIGDIGMVHNEVSNIGNVFDLMQIPDSGLYYQQIVYDAAQKSTDREKYTRPEMMFRMGNSYNLKGDKEKAMYFYKQGIKEANIDNDTRNLTMNNLFLAKLYDELNMPDSSIKYAYNAIQTGKTISFRKGVYDASVLISGLFKKRNRDDSAYKYLSIANVEKDSLTGIKRFQELQRIILDEQERERSAEAKRIADQNKQKQIALLAGLAIFLIIASILYRNNKQKQKANKVLEATLANLKSTQSQLVQSEKMASLGELTAGIAHEIQNPLNFVNNFSEVNTELIGEMKEELSKGNIEEAKKVADDINDNERKINFHGKRADAIVKGMLQHSRRSSGVKEPTDINSLADEYFRLAYHGLRAKDNSFNALTKTDFDKTVGNINIVPQDMGRVILNLITNAFYVVDEKKKQTSNGYEPTVSVSTKKTGDKISISVKDNGNGIPQKVLDKIFQPFFTTKPTGQGTGLGLSLSYDIVKAHGGEIKVETKEGEGTEFIIQLPA